MLENSCAKADPALPVGRSTTEIARTERSGVRAKTNG